MTLVITGINRDLGIWQSSDHALTVGGKRVDSDWCKQVAVFCRNGRALLGYSGLARSPSRLSIAEHIAKAAAPKGRAYHYRGDMHTVFDPIPITNTLLCIRDYMTARFKDWHKLRNYEQASLFISGGAVENGTPIFVAIFNRDDNGEVLPEFQLGTIDANEHQASVIAHGSGERQFLDGGHSIRVARILGQRPRMVENYLSLLTSVNRRVARERNRQDVTQWSQAAFMPLDGWPMQGRMYHPPDVRLPRKFNPVRVVLGGTDLSAAHDRISPVQSDRLMSYTWSFGWESADLPPPPPFPPFQTQP